MGGPFALDYAAVLHFGEARGVDLDLLAQTLPHAEAAILSGRDGGEDPTEEEE